MKRSDPFAAMIEARARLMRSSVQPKIKLCRMHPLDIATIAKRTADAFGAESVRLDRVVGIPLEPDCAVRRGRPELDVEQPYQGDPGDEQQPFPRGGI